MSDKGQKQPRAKKAKAEAAKTADAVVAAAIEEVRDPNYVPRFKTALQRGRAARIDEGIRLQECTAGAAHRTRSC